jgi:hypothetical protein
MKTELKQNLKGLTGESAKLVLDEVRRRYGIDAPHHGERAGISLTPGVPQPQPQQPPGSGSGAASRTSDPVSNRGTSLGVPANFAWGPYPARVEAKSTREDSPAGKWVPSVPKEVHAFHYLIRIMECTSVLHCEVFAENVTAARRQVDQIPNLVECREVSAMTLAEIERGNLDQRLGTAVSFRAQRCSAELTKTETDKSERA